MTTTNEGVSRDHRVPKHFLEPEPRSGTTVEDLASSPNVVGRDLTKFPSPDFTSVTSHVKNSGPARPWLIHTYLSKEEESPCLVDGQDPPRLSLQQDSPVNSIGLRSRAHSSSTSSLSSCISNPIFPGGEYLGSSTKGGSNEGSHSDIKPPQPSGFTSRHVTTTFPEKPRVSTISPYFPKSPSKRIKREQGSCIPFPPLESNNFGLVQESLSHDPFQLFIAVIFLNKTRGAVAMPVFYNLISQYPGPDSLAAADHQDIVSVFQHLGLQNQRARKCIGLAKTWLENPPVKGKRHRRLHYPRKDDGKDISSTEPPLADDDPRVAWEVGHLVGIGSYGIDSWRIFCRDQLRGLPYGLPSLVELQDAKVREAELGKEWTRVVPMDKELRAYLRWRWLRLGFEWDCMTGERKVADPKYLEAAKCGGVIYEGEDGHAVEGGMLTVKSGPEEEDKLQGSTVETKYHRSTAEGKVEEGRKEESAAMGQGQEKAENNGTTETVPHQLNESKDVRP